MKINYTDPPEKTQEELYETYHPNMYLIIEDVLKTPDNFRYIFQDMIDIMKYGYTNPLVRNQIQRFKFHRSDKEYYGLPRKRFIPNLIIWKHFVDEQDTDSIDASYIFNFDHYKVNDLIEYINVKILDRYEGGFHSRNLIVAEIFETMIAISRAFTPLMGMSVSNYDIMLMEERNPELTDLMYRPIDISMQPVEIEADLNNRIHSVMDIIENDTEYNHFKMLYGSGNILKVGQSREIWCRIGLKGDINNHTIPFPIDANFLIDGLNRPSYFYINNLAGRKASIFGKQNMWDPGVFSQQLNQAATPVGILRKDFEMCDSARPIIYNIKDDSFLKRLHGRYYYDEGEMKLLHYSEDKHLIGKTIAFRSPCTCNSKEGICMYCYGKYLFETNQDLFSAGALAALKTGEPLGQSQLSTKHEQNTHSSQLKLGDDFDNSFEMSNGEITINSNAELEENCAIKFGDDVVFEEMDDNEMYYCKRFDLISGDGSLICHVEEESGAKLYFGEAITKLYAAARDKSAPIVIGNLEEDEVLFNIEIGNKDVTTALKMMRSILGTQEHGGANTLDELCQKYAEVAEQCGNKFNLVHGEMILRSLIRKKSNILEFPEWGKNEDHNDYQLLFLSKAIRLNPSPVVQLTTRRLKSKILSPSFFHATKPSHLDPLIVDILTDYV